jgi:hypothetical protein
LWPFGIFFPFWEKSGSPDCYDFGFTIAHWVCRYFRQFFANTLLRQSWVRIPARVQGIDSFQCCYLWLNMWLWKKIDDNNWKNPDCQAINWRSVILLRQFSLRRSNGFYSTQDWAVKFSYETLSRIVTRALRGYKLFYLAITQT